MVIPTEIAVPDRLNTPRQTREEPEYNPNTGRTEYTGKNPNRPNTGLIHRRNTGKIPNRPNRPNTVRTRTGRTLRRRTFRTVRTGPNPNRPNRSEPEPSEQTADTNWNHMKNSKAKQQPKPKKKKAAKQPRRMERRTTCIHHQQGSCVKWTSSYKAELCKFHLDGFCYNGESCYYAHSEWELRVCIPLFSSRFYNPLIPVARWRSLGSCGFCVNYRLPEVTFC